MPVIFSPGSKRLRLRGWDPRDTEKKVKKEKGDKKCDIAKGGWEGHACQGYPHEKLKKVVGVAGISPESLSAGAPPVCGLLKKTMQLCISNAITRKCHNP